MYSRLHKSCTSKKKKKNNPLFKYKIRSLAREIGMRKHEWNYLFEKYENHRSDLSLKNDCLEELNIYEEEKNEHLMKCDDNSLNPGTKCITKSYLTPSTSESVDSGIGFNSIVDSVTDSVSACPNSRGENRANCNLRPGEENYLNTIVESSILHHNVNSRPQEYSGKMSLEECERNGCEENSSERSNNCGFSDPRPLKIECKLAERLGNQTTVSSSKNCYFESGIPERFDNIGDDIFKNNCSSPTPFGSKTQVTDTLQLINKRDSSVQQCDAVETYGINIRDQIKCDLKYKCIVRSEIIQDNCCNDVANILAESQENGSKGWMQTENSHNQVLCNVSSKLDPVNVLTAEYENKQNNSTSASKLQVLEDNFASDSYSSTCVEEIMNEKVSQKESCSVQQCHSSVLEHTQFESNLKGTSHGTNMLSLAPNKTSVLEEQNKISVIKMTVNKKMIMKDVGKERNNDKDIARLTDLSSKIDCDEKMHQDRHCMENMRERSEREPIFDSTNRNTKVKKSRKHSKWNVEYSNFTTHHWEEILNNSGSLLIPLPKKRKNLKLKTLDWESIINDKQ